MWGRSELSSAHLGIESINQRATYLVDIVTRLIMFYIKTVSVKKYAFHNCENCVNVSHDCPTKRDGSSFKSLVVQPISHNNNVDKYKFVLHR